MSPIRHLPSRSGPALAAALALSLVACAGGVAEPPAPSTSGATAPGASEDGSEPAPEVTLEGRGITADGCVQPAGGRSTPGNGCIYLGVLAGLTLEAAGEFAPLAQRAVVDFWAAVNAAGGIGGLDVDVETFLRDTADDPVLHVQRYLEIAPEVLLIAHSWGTATTVALLGELAEDRMLAAPVSAWSGVHVPDGSPWLLPTSAHPACLAPMLGLDWFAEQVRPVEGVHAVVAAGPVGEEVAVGVRTWAERNGVAFLGTSVRGPDATGDDPGDVIVPAVLDSGADVVVLGVDPATTAEVIRRVADVAPLGSILFVGVGSSWSPSALQTPAAAALIGFYTHVAPWEDFLGDAPGHAAMRAAFGQSMPLNSGYAAGWIGQYPVRALLEAMVASGDASPEHLARLATDLEVTYEGILPDTRGRAGAARDIERSAVIGRVNPESENGLDMLAEGYRGTTAGAFDLRVPCVPLAP